MRKERAPVQGRITHNQRIAHAATSRKIGVELQEKTAFNYKGCTEGNAPLRDKTRARLSCANSALLCTMFIRNTTWRPRSSCTFSMNVSGQPSWNSCHRTWRRREGRRAQSGGFMFERGRYKTHIYNQRFHSLRFKHILQFERLLSGRGRVHKSDAEGVPLNSTFDKRDHST